MGVRLRLHGDAGDWLRRAAEGISGIEAFSPFGAYRRVRGSRKATAAFAFALTAMYGSIFGDLLRDVAREYEQLVRNRRTAIAIAERFERGECSFSDRFCREAFQDAYLSGGLSGEEAYGVFVSTEIDKGHRGACAQREMRNGRIAVCVTDSSPGFTYSFQIE